jgi:hypothetical protein
MLRYKIVIHGGMCVYVRACERVRERERHAELSVRNLTALMIHGDLQAANNKNLGNQDTSPLDL